MSLDKIISSFNASKDEHEVAVEAAKKALQSAKEKASSDAVAIFTENPENFIDHDVIKGSIGVDAVLTIVETVICFRPLKIEEMTDEMLRTIVSQTYRIQESKDKDYDLANSVFDTLDTHEKRVKFALHGNTTLSAISASKSAKEFLYNEFKVSPRYSTDKKDSTIRPNGYHNNLKQIGFQISMTKKSYNGIEDVADTILSLVNGGSKIQSVDVFEHTLSEYACIFMTLFNEDNVFEPKVHEGRWAEVEFEGKDAKSKLVAALKYVADNHWYESNEDDND